MRFTEFDFEMLRIEYKIYRDSANLKALAIKMGRTVPLICRKAKLLGLTDRINRVSMKHLAPEISIQRREFIAKNGHNRGMLGKKQTEKCRTVSRERFKKKWENPQSHFNSQEFRLNRSRMMSQRRQLEPANKTYTRGKFGWFKKNEELIFMRSSWELNYAHYLNSLIKNGQIIDWQYESDTFLFKDSKIRSYKPDFKITKKLSIEYHEIKGWMKQSDYTKLELMRLQYPAVEVILIGQDKYREIEKTFLKQNPRIEFVITPINQ